MFKNVNVHGGFTPAAWLPPNAIIPEQGIRHYRCLSAGAVRGDRHCPLVQLSRAFIFIS